MVFIFGRKSKAKRVKDGQFEKRKCPECEATTVFREVEVQNDYTAFLVVKLFDTKRTAFACDACCEIMDLEDTLAPELSAREQKQLEAQQARELAARQKAIERKAKTREAAKQQRAQKIDDELALLKKQLGKS